MAVMRVFKVKSFSSSLESACRFYSRSLSLYENPVLKRNSEQKGFRVMASVAYGQHPVGFYMNKSSYLNGILGVSCLQNGNSISGINSIHMHNRRFFSSPSGTKDSLPQALNSVSSTSPGGGDWPERVKEIWESTVGSRIVTYSQQLLETHPYLRDVIVPFGGTLIGTILAWSLLPRIFKRIHRYSTHGTEALLAGSKLWSPVPYEKSFWGALEAPVRYFLTTMAFLELGQVTAPAIIASQYVENAWKGGLVVAFVWFLNRWKVNVISRAASDNSIGQAERDRLLALDRISSLGLFAFGSLVFAEASGVAIQSILTVGGIGGVATAFAARDILGNLFSGLSIQMSQPFSIGDTIKAGSVEGQVIGMGLTTTSLLTAEKFPVIVPNSLFSSQVIVNKSRAKWRFIVKQIPLRIDDVEKIPQLSEDIKSMLNSNSHVFLEKEPPYCFLSDIGDSYAQLTFGCNLKHMNKEAEQDILLQAIRIIKSHGVELGKPQDYATV